MYKTCISLVSCTITKEISPRLATIKDPSPSVKPINQVNHCKLGQLIFGINSLYFSIKLSKLKYLDLQYKGTMHNKLYVNEKM